MFCFSLASLFPGLLLFGTGALYGMMGLGKKYVPLFSVFFFFSAKGLLFGMRVNLGTVN